MNQKRMIRTGCPSFIQSRHFFFVDAIKKKAKKMDEKGTELLLREEAGTRQTRQLADSCPETLRLFKSLSHR